MDYYNTGIKDVIKVYPKIGDLLAAYDVDCVACAVGTCLLKDVLDIHNFSPDEKNVINRQMEQIMNKEEVDLSAIPQAQDRKKPSISKAIKMLMDEHRNILRLLDLAQYLADRRELTVQNMETLDRLVFFIRNYADKYHHAKEENILFARTGENQEIIKAMLTEHVMGRNFVSEAVAGAKVNSREQIRQGLCGYIDLLREHIRKEDTILYPWFDRAMSDSEKDGLFEEFEAVKGKLDANLEESLLEFLDANYA